jgi:hypothetical protein
MYHPSFHCDTFVTAIVLPRFDIRQGDQFTYGVGYSKEDIRSEVLPKLMQTDILRNQPTNLASFHRFYYGHICVDVEGGQPHVQKCCLTNLLEHTCSRPECLVFTFQVLALVILYSVKDRAIARAIARAIDRAIDRALVYRTVVRYGNVSVRSVHICCIDMVRKTHTS